MHRSRGSAVFLNQASLAATAVMRGVICVMKSLLPLSIMLLAVGCLSQSKSARLDVPKEVQTGTKSVSYEALSSPPDAILDEMDLKYSGDNKQWRKEWKEDNSAIPIDGQRVLYLLEVACYADNVCHRIEYPLRVATLDYVKENLTSSGVTDALQWIRSSYKSGLPQEVPGDEKGDFSGMIVDAMNVRLVEYANEVLRSSELTETSK